MRTRQGAPLVDRLARASLLKLGLQQRATSRVPRRVAGREYLPSLREARHGGRRPPCGLTVTPAGQRSGGPSLRFCQLGGQPALLFSSISRCGPAARFALGKSASQVAHLVRDRRLVGETAAPQTLVTPATSQPDRAEGESERYCCGALTANAVKGGGAFLSFAS